MNIVGTYQMTYDPLNRMTRYQSDGVSATYTYGIDNMRKSKTVNGVTTNYLWDGGNIVAEADSNNAITNRYFRGVGLIASKTGDTVSYYQTDSHGDVSKWGTVDYSYDAFGNETTDSNGTNPFRYNGEYFDEETGFIYLRNRYYNPTNGRFTTDDPAKDGLNWYAYCANNPVMFVDPWGLEFTTLRELVATSEGGSITTYSDHATVKAYGKTATVYYDTSKNNYEMINIDGRIYMDRAEFLNMMGVDAIITSTGKYEISSTNAMARTVMANAPIYIASTMVGGKIASFVPKNLLKKAEMVGSIATGLGVVNLTGSLKINAGTYVEEHFLVKYDNEYLHSMGVITQVNDNGVVQQTTRINSVTPISWGLPWEEREAALKNSLVSKPNASVTRLYSRN